MEDQTQCTWCRRLLPRFILCKSFFVTKETNLLSVKCCAKIAFIFFRQSICVIKKQTVSVKKRRKKKRFIEVLWVKCSKLFTGSSLLIRMKAKTSPIHTGLWVLGSCPNSPPPSLCEGLRGSEGWKFRSRTDLLLEVVSELQQNRTEPVWMDKPAVQSRGVSVW